MMSLLFIVNFINKHNQTFLHTAVTSTQPTMEFFPGPGITG